MKTRFLAMIDKKPLALLVTDFFGDAYDVWQEQFFPHQPRPTRLRLLALGAHVASVSGGKLPIGKLEFLDEQITENPAAIIPLDFFNLAPSYPMPQDPALYFTPTQRIRARVVCPREHPLLPVEVTISWSLEFDP